MRGFADLSNMPEDERIRVIGEFAEQQPSGMLIGIIVDHDTARRKVRRYCEKLTSRFKVRIVDMSPGPVSGSTVIRITPKKEG